MSDQDKLLRKVRGLLAQAEDPAATDAEAEAFSAKAEELIAKYAIDTALLEAKRHKGKPTSRRYEAQTPYGKAKVSLAHGIALAFGARVIRHGGDNSFTVFGFEGDLAAVDMLYTSLLLQGANGSQRGDRAFRTAFWYGFADRVGQRLASQRKQAAAESGEPGTALVLADRKVEVDQAVAEAFPHVRKGRSTRLSSGAGMAAGRAAGDRANIGQGGLAGSRKVLA